MTGRQRQTLRGSIDLQRRLEIASAEIADLRAENSKLTLYAGNLRYRLRQNTAERDRLRATCRAMARTNKRLAVKVNDLERGRDLWRVRATGRVAAADRTPPPRAAVGAGNTPNEEAPARSTPPQAKARGPEGDEMYQQVLAEAVSADVAAARQLGWLT